MATLRRAIKIRPDENESENLKILQLQIGKNLKTTTTKTTKRAALGELGNHHEASTNSLKVKDVQLLKDNLKEVKHVNLRNTAKPRVDTYWKESNVLGATKKLTRTNSVINSFRAATVSAEGVQLKKSSATTSKSSKLTVVRPINRVACKVITTKPIVPIINKPKINNPLSLRREDSKLSTRSITKLRAALSKNANNKKKDDNSKIEKPTITNNNKITVKETTTTNTEEIQCIKIKESEIISHSVQMINLIENIDINDSDSLTMMPEYVNDIYSYLYNLENIFPIQIDYMKNQTEVTPKMRKILIDWIHEVSEQFHLISETYQMAVSIIDRYLQAVPTITRKKFQLIGVTAIFIAVKYEELYPSDIDDFVYITDSTYSKSHILRMEIKIMTALDFQLCRPIPIIFLRRFAKAANAESDQYLLSKYILELVTIQYSFVHYKPSEIAASALYLSMQLFNKNNISIEKLWTPTLVFYTHYKIDQLKSIVKQIAEIIYNAPQSQQKSVYKKYESNKFNKISTKSELYGSIIQKIIYTE